MATTIINTLNCLKHLCWLKKMPAEMMCPRNIIDLKWLSIFRKNITLVKDNLTAKYVTRLFVIILCHLCFKDPESRMHDTHFILRLFRFLTNSDWSNISKWISYLTRDLNSRFPRSNPFNMTHRLYCIFKMWDMRILLKCIQVNTGRCLQSSIQKPVHDIHIHQRVIQL